MLKYGRVYLQQIVDDYDAKGGGGGGDGLVAEPVSSNTTVSDNDSSLTPGQTYKLAIFQLLDDLEGVTPCLALASFCMGCVNIPLGKDSSCKALIRDYDNHSQTKFTVWLLNF